MNIELTIFIGIFCLTFFKAECSYCIFKYCVLFGNLTLKVTSN